MTAVASDSLGKNPSVQSDFFDDFNSLDTVGLWSDVSGDSGAAPSLAADGDSAAVLTTGATNNNECYLVSNRAWDLTVGSQIVAECRVIASEAATNALNLIFGLVSGAGANALLDNGGGPPASYSGAVIYKVDGGDKWLVESSVGSSQNSDESQRVSSSVAYQTLKIQIDVIGATEAEVTFHIGQEGGSYTRQVQDGVNFLPIKHTIDPTSFAAANLVIGAKAGAASSETPRFDFVRVSQTK